MSRIDTEQAVVVERFTAALRAALGLNDRRCYEVLEPLSPPIIPQGGDWFLTVAAGDSRFDPEHQVGGGAAQLTEYLPVIVTIYSRIRLDATDREAATLRHVTRGLLPLKKRVLQALVGRDLTDALGNPLLRQFVYAISATRPQVVEARRSPMALAVMGITFRLDFDWDLS